MYGIFYRNAFYFFIFFFFFKSFLIFKPQYYVAYFCIYGRRTLRSKSVTVNCHNQKNVLKKNKLNFSGLNVGI
jgi:hypothetical protein